MKPGTNIGNWLLGLLLPGWMMEIMHDLESYDAVVPAAQGTSGGTAFPASTIISEATSQPETKDLGASVRRDPLSSEP